MHACVRACGYGTAGETNVVGWSQAAHEGSITHPTNQVRSPWRGARPARNGHGLHNFGPSRHQPESYDPTTRESPSPILFHSILFHSFHSFHSFLSLHTANYLHHHTHGWLVCSKRMPSWNLLSSSSSPPPPLAAAAAVQGPIVHNNNTNNNNTNDNTNNNDNTINNNTINDNNDNTINDECSHDLLTVCCSLQLIPTMPDTTNDTDTDHTCPLCCNDFTPADVTFPIHCPTPSCHFNFCSDCIQSLLQSYHDGYQTASDGSQQVRVWLQCPQCRGKYQCAAAADDALRWITSEMVVTAYSTVRAAYTMTQVWRDTHNNSNKSSKQNDSDWSASALAQREHYRHTQDLDSVRTAWERIHRYQQAIHKAPSSPPLPELPWEQLAQILPASPSSTLHPLSNSATAATNNNNNNNSITWKDPTLLMGLDELMNDAEQEYVTTLLTNGTVDGLAHAALTLHSILTLAATGARNPTQTTTSNTSTQRTNPASRPRPTQPSQQRPYHHKAVLDVHKLRKLYPLPPHMPTCVALPVYDPLVSKPLLKFVATDTTTTTPESTTTTTTTTSSSSPSPLTIHSVKGPAGRLGLRKGDVVTHVNGEPVETLPDFGQAMHWAYVHRTDADETVLVVVNATPAVAHALQERAERMKQRQHGQQRQQS